MRKQLHEMLLSQRKWCSITHKPGHPGIKPLVTEISTISAHLSYEYVCDWLFPFPPFSRAAVRIIRSAPSLYSASVCKLRSVIRPRRKWLTDVCLVDLFSQVNRTTEQRDNVISVAFLNQRPPFRF